MGGQTKSFSFYPFIHDSILKGMANFTQLDARCACDIQSDYTCRLLIIIMSCMYHAVCIPVR